MTVTAVVPLKNLARAKTRLASLLDDGERRALVRAMLEDVLGALVGSRLVTEIYVIVDRPWPLPAGVGQIEEPGNRGYNEAIATALADPRLASAGAMLVLPGDLPLASAAEIDSLLDGHACPGIRIVGARDGDGTNALLIAPPTLMPTAFGAGSFQRHRRVAAAVTGVELAAAPGLAFDIDTPHDLRDFCSTESKTATLAYLRQSGVAERLCHTG